MNRNQRRLAKGQNKTQTLLEDANKLHQKGNFAEAERQYKRILVENGGNAEALHLLGVLYIQTGKEEDAIDLINRAIQLNQNIAVYHSNLAIALQNLGRFDEAAQQFQTAVYIKPDHFEAYNALGDILKNKGEYVEAIKYYEQALAINPNFVEGFNNLGIALQGLKNFDQAMDFYKRAISINSNYVDAHNNLGSVLQEKGLPEEAIKSYQNALAINPNYLLGHYNLGNEYLKLGHKEKAIKHFTRCLELDSEDLYGASLLLANLGQQALPTRASDAQLQRLYIKRAQSWSNMSETSEFYKAPQLVANALFNLHTENNKIDMLDAGCGTGLVGLLVKDIANKLDGIDISLPMLEQAKSKQVYDALFESDLVTFMASNPNAYDAITCSATLIHFGDLNPALHAASQALRPNGLFICTLFPNENGQDFSAANSGLVQGGCYSHSKNYIERVAKVNNFTVELLITEIHEYGDGQPIEGLVVGLKRISS